MSKDSPEPPDPIGDADADSGEAESDEPEPLDLPAWIPSMIGIVLVAMASLAVYTGLHGRSRPLSLSPHAVSNPEPASGLAESGAPGEPQAGASRVVHGAMGETVPEPADNELSDGENLMARRGMLLHVLPEDAVVQVNDQPIGQAIQFRAREEAYEFADPGDYRIRLTAAGYEDAVYVVTADETAPDELVVIEARLVRKK